ncbi:hypothetical protein COV18_05830 [Candidatus Woesearchaeota archaeon CG10_big_fil_rev_8_21_14_0_10_37_12]|nr:MAG: hypothetical protein COV18_05830 [Candidatus Woesearchaeota archaeon CG10_big_fil_rev_8_21_14_0_10_37_12]
MVSDAGLEKILSIGSEITLTDFRRIIELMRIENMRVISCRAGQEIANRITDHLSANIRKEFGSKFPKLADGLVDTSSRLLPVGIKNHPDGETYARIDADVSGRDVYVVQTFPNPNEDIMELVTMCDALHRSGADNITIVAPYLPYQRQDRQVGHREPITATALFRLLESVGKGIYRFITFDLHSPQVQGSPSAPVQNLSAVPLFAAHYRQTLAHLYDHASGGGNGFLERNLSVFSPDAGGVPRAAKLAELLGVAPRALLKRRPAQGEVSTDMYVFDWDHDDGASVILVDDMVDTGGTIAAAASYLRDKGLRVYLCATHALMSEKEQKGTVIRAYKDNIKPSGAHFLTTDSLPERGELYAQNDVTVVSLAYDLAYAIFARQARRSIRRFLEARETTKLTSHKLDILTSGNQRIR